MHPLLYLLLLLILVPMLVCLPLHLAMRRVFRRR
jgi:hypothetical protein